MRAYIRLWGNDYLLTQVDWHGNGELSSVAFRDENNKFYVILNMHSVLTSDAETNRYSDYPIHADLEEVVFWTEKKPTVSSEQD
ncbi:hypothetical protein [Oceanobacillus profundus]|uniref:Uncharacterized protein n=1 Tax=Oceanobacillus profundus TaxID=372463 RepID=A0A417YJV1_9BACI|nr:hypothetical protein [Oceanobacillus profundus]RHW33548.1 hypothetical protein D1B32_05770 [Oceanobacillus profundus]